MRVSNDELKQHALEIFELGLRAVDPFVAVKRCVSRGGTGLQLCDGSAAPIALELDDFDRVWLVGGGKASAPMCRALEELLGDRISGGLINVKYGHTAMTRTELVEAGHPIPDEAGEAGAQRMLALLEPLGERDLVFCLISGGGSALLPLPADGVTLAEKQKVTGALLEGGAEIGEINAVRKHISGLKGGQLARVAAPATLVNLMLSDVVGDRLDVIASGPTVPDPSTFAEAQSILVHYGLWSKAPPSIQDRLQRGAVGELTETPKAGELSLTRTINLVIGGNRVALEACAEGAREAGYRPLLLASTVEGETRDVARMHAAMGKEIARYDTPLPKPACLISGGETTVTIRGSGKGGRNQEFALAAALELDGGSGVAVFSGGTDGNDGPTDAAGAIAFGNTRRRAAAAGLNARRHLEQNDAYPLFEAIGDLVKTGPTNTNVMDIHLVLVR